MIQTQADADVLLDAIEERREDAAVSDLFERVLGTREPTATCLFDLAVIAVRASRLHTAAGLFADGRSLDRWAEMPPELQRFVRFETKIAKDELSHTLEVDRIRLGRYTSPVPGCFVFRDRQTGNGDDADEQGDLRWWCFHNEGVARNLALDNAWREIVRDSVNDRTNGRPTISREGAKRRAREYLEHAGLGELLGVSPGRNGQRTASGFLVFDQGGVPW